MKMKFSDRLFGWINAFLLLLFTLIILYPIYYMFIVSISGSGPVMRAEVSIIPLEPTLDAYRVILGFNSFLRSYCNTIFYTVAGTLVNLFMTALCAYPLSRSDLYGRSAITVFIVIATVFDAGMIPGFMLVNSLHLRNTIWAILLPGAISGYNMILMRTFFQNIPVDLIEAARIDGASEKRIVAQIILPLSKPIFASLALMYAVGHWNSYLPPLLYLDDKKLYPLQLILRNVVISSELSELSGGMSAYSVNPLNIKYAVIFVSILPIICVYPFIQKYFEKGIMIGSLKG